MEHIGKDDLAVFFFSTPNRSLHARVAKHLLDRCTCCHSRAREVLKLTAEPQKISPLQDLTVFFQESALLKEERRKAVVSWAKLAPLEELERVEVMKTRWRFKKYGLAAYVLDEAEALSAKGRRDKARELIRFSAAVTDCLPHRIYGSAPIADLKLRQETVLSNILRLDLDFIGALEALRKAEKVINEGIDLVERARFFRVQGMLLFDLGEFEEGAKAARERRRLHDVMRDYHSKGKALIQEAMILANFDPQAGLERANQGLEILNPADSYPFITGLFNKAYCLIQLGRAEDASIFLSVHREIIHEVADISTELWFQHLDALILKSRRQMKDAETIIHHLALRFREEGMLKDMILQHLELIRIKIETGRWKSAANLATRLTPELARLGLRNDLLAMWASLQDALSQRRNAVHEIERLFRRRWNAPARWSGGFVVPATLFMKT